MKKQTIIIPIMIILILSFVNAVQVCVNTTDGRNVCNQYDSNVFPQNINLWEGQNEEFNLFITNPANTPAMALIRDALNTNDVDVRTLTDGWVFQFQNQNDFYNLVQQSNALGNVSLYTKSDINREVRDKTMFLISDNLNYSVTLIVITLELFKMILSTLLIILMVYMFFRLIPFVFKHSVIILFKIIVWSERK